MGTWFSKGGITGTTEVMPAGHTLYIVTADNGATLRTDVSSLARRIAAEWAIYPPTPADRAQMAAVDVDGATLTVGDDVHLPTAAPVPGPSWRIVEIFFLQPGNHPCLRLIRTAEARDAVAGPHEPWMTAPANMARKNPRADDLAAPGARALRIRPVVRRHTHDADRTAGAGDECWPVCA